MQIVEILTHQRQGLNLFCIFNTVAVDVLAIQGGKASAVMVLIYFSQNVHRPGVNWNIKMLSYQYRNSHYKDKMVVSQLSFLYNDPFFNGKSYT